MSSAATSDIAWRIEQTCFHAWPALKEIACNGWLLRFADGLSRRANSVNPLSEDVDAPDALVGMCEAHYRGQQLPTIFRLPSLIDPSIQSQLEKRGYMKEGESLVLYAELNKLPADADKLEIIHQPTSDWLADMSRQQKHDNNKRQTYENMLRLITVPAAFARIKEQGQVAALAYGAIQGKLLCVESVITDEAFRRKGHSRQILAALAEWARKTGAEGICIQVQADNKPAVALYNSLGLEELYRYHYMRQPVIR